MGVVSSVNIVDGIVSQSFAEFFSTDTTQSYTIRASVGATYLVDWGDGTITSGTGTGSDQTVAHNYSNPGAHIVWVIDSPTSLIRFFCNNNQLTGNIPLLSDKTALSSFYCNDNQLTGSIPSLSSNTALVNFWCYTNSLSGSIPSFSSNTLLQYFLAYDNDLTGSIPSLSNNTALYNFSVQDNLLTGSIPSLSANTALTLFRCDNNQLTGSIPSLSNNTALQFFYCSNQAITGYTASTLATTMISLIADGCAFTQSAVDQILADFATNINNRPTSGGIHLSDGTSAAPSAAGLASKATILAARPSWNVHHNS